MHPWIHDWQLGAGAILYFESSSVRISYTPNGIKYALDAILVKPIGLALE